VEARTRAQTQQIEAETRAKTHRLEAESQGQATRMAAEAEAEAQRIKSVADLQALQSHEQTAESLAAHPILLRLRELETLRELAQVASARIYIGFDKHSTNSYESEED